MIASTLLSGMGKDHLAMGDASLHEEPADAMEAHFFVKADNRNLGMEIDRLNLLLPSRLDGPF